MMRSLASPSGGLEFGVDYDESKIKKLQKKLGVPIDPKDEEPEPVIAGYLAKFTNQYDRPLSGPKPSEA